MKAAVLFEKGGMPQYVNVPEPVLQNEDEVVIFMKAAALKHLDKSRATGKHYSATDTSKATIIGGDGVGVLADGTRVYAVGMSGMMAEKAIAEKNRMVRVPDLLDDVTAAALPNAVMGSAMALRFRANLQHGETVLINGATGFTGKIAVQLAKLYGAKTIIVTGRNPQSLEALRTLGADELISLNQNDEDIVAQIRALHQRTRIDVIMDYLWGHPAELILAALKGRGAFTHRTRFVSIGAMTGDLLRLSAENLRSVDLQLSGSGLGSWTKEQVQLLIREILPETFQLAADKKLQVDTLSMKLEDIGKVWDMEVPDGKRLVVTI